MICPNCDKENKDDVKFCIYCGQGIIKERIDDSSSDKSMVPNILVGLALGIVLIDIFFSKLFDVYALEDFLAQYPVLYAIVFVVLYILPVGLILTAKLKYPNNLFAKIIFWILAGILGICLVIGIILVIVGLVSGVGLIFQCGVSCYDFMRTMAGGVR